MKTPMRGSRKFCQSGVQIEKVMLLFFFLSFYVFYSLFILVDEGAQDPNTTLNGPSSARQQPAI